MKVLAKLPAAGVGVNTAIGYVASTVVTPHTRRITVIQDPSKVSKVAAGIHDPLPRCHWTADQQGLLPGYYAYSDSTAD